VALPTLVVQLLLLLLPLRLEDEALDEVAEQTDITPDGAMAVLFVVAIIFACSIGEDMGTGDSAESRRGPSIFCVESEPVPACCSTYALEYCGKGAVSMACVVLTEVNPAFDCDIIVYGSEILLLLSFTPNQVVPVISAISPGPVGPDSIPCPWTGEILVFPNSTAAVVVSSIASWAKSASRDSINWNSSMIQMTGTELRRCQHQLPEYNTDLL